MSEQLRHYLAFNNGLKVVQAKGDSVNEVGEFFSGKTLEHLMGCRQKPEVVFAAVAFDGGYRTEDGGRSWQKVLEGNEWFTRALDPSASFAAKTTESAGNPWTACSSSPLKSRSSGRFRQPTAG